MRGFRLSSFYNEDKDLLVCTDGRHADALIFVTNRDFCVGKNIQMFASGRINEKRACDMKEVEKLGKSRWLIYLQRKGHIYTLYRIRKRTQKQTGVLSKIPRSTRTHIHTYVYAWRYG